MTPRETQELRDIVAGFKKVADGKLEDLEAFKAGQGPDFWAEHKINERMDGILRHVENLNVIGRKLNDMSGIPNPEQAD